MAQKRLFLTGKEIAEYLRKSFTARRVVVRLVDHGHDVEMEFIAHDGTTTHKLDPIPLDRLSTVEQLDVLIAQVNHHLDEA